MNWGWRPRLALQAALQAALKAALQAALEAALHPALHLLVAVGIVACTGCDQILRAAGTPSKAVSAPGNIIGKSEAGAGRQLTLAGQDLYEQAEGIEAVGGTADGLELARGVLIEDDGPAFGVFDPAAESGRALRKDAASQTDTPYWEPIGQKAWIRKTLLVGPLSSRHARVMAFAATTRPRAAPLIVQVNGRAAGSLVMSGGPAPPRWCELPIDPSLLKTGENEIVLRTESDSPDWLVLIAPKDQFVRGSLARRTAPGRSQRSDDAGRTWQANKLGRDGSASGEYAVRLFLDQFAVSGKWTGPVMDLAVGDDPGPIHRAVTFKSADGQILQSLPSGGRVDWEVRAGSLGVITKETWEPWAKLAVDSAGRFSIPDLGNRYVQFRANLFSEDPAASPVIRSIRLVGQGPKIEPAPGGLVHVLDCRNPQIVRSSVNFTYETMPTSRLAALDTKFDLAASVRGARTQFEQAARVLDWLTQRGRRGLFLPGPLWHAADILATQTTGPTQPLPYQIVLCEALLSRGLTARIVMFAGPSSCRSATEFWSADYSKWVLMDGKEGEYFIDSATGVPLGAMELHTRLVRAGGRGQHDQAPVSAEGLGLVVVSGGGVRPAGHPVDGWAAGRPLLIPRNNFASADRPLPLNPEWTAPGWSEFVAWAGPEPSPRAGARNPGPRPDPWLARRVNRDRDLDWTLNQARMEVQYGQAPGELWVHLDTVTPSFDTYQVNVDETGWKAIPGSASFRWWLVPGPNDLKVRVRNKAGAGGAASELSVRFFPPASQPD